MTSHEEVAAQWDIVRMYEFAPGKVVIELRSGGARPATPLEVDMWRRMGGTVDPPGTASV